ncbi:DUF6804 family protein [Flavobacterium sp. GB2R13]
MKIILSILLMACLLYMPYGYYQFVRFTKILNRKTPSFQTFIIVLKLI